MFHERISTASSAKQVSSSKNPLAVSFSSEDEDLPDLSVPTHNSGKYSPPWYLYSGDQPSEKKQKRSNSPSPLAYALSKDKTLPHEKTLKTHEISDSESDEEIVPLSERLHLNGVEQSDVGSHGRSTELCVKNSSHSIRKPCNTLEETTKGQTCVSNINKNEMKKLERTGVITEDNKETMQKNLQNKKKRKEEEKRLKEEEKQKKKEELEERKRLKEYEKTKKKTLKEAQKTARPGEAKKHMTLMIDPAVMKTTAGSSVIDTLQKHEINYEIEAQPLPGLVTFWREVTEVLETQPFQVDTVKKEVVEEDILLAMPINNFIQCVHCFKQRQLGLYGNGAGTTLKEHITKVRKTLENRKVTLVIHGVEKYFREQRTKGQRQYRDQVTGSSSHTAAKGKGKKKDDADNVSRLDIEEALIDAQLYTGCCVQFVNSDHELGRTILQYTKAVAEAPFKRDRLNTGLSMFVETSGSVKINKEGHGVSQAWRSQLQQFKNVTAEVANAIMSEYRSPLELYKAYATCSTEKDGELLLQDIVIRRGVGVMATSRRIGKELSRRLYQLFTSDDPDVVLK